MRNEHTGAIESKSVRTSRALSGWALTGLLAVGAPMVTTLVTGEAHAQRRSEARPVELTVGESEAIQNDGVSTFTNGDDTVAQVDYDDNTGNFLVRARRAGETELLLIYDDGRQVRYRITVRARVQAAAGMEVLARDDIRLDLYFVELRESYTHQIGISYPSSFPPGGAGFQGELNFDLVTATLTRATASITEALLPRLDLAQTAGWARLLRQAVLVTVNGEQATIDAGGEINIVVTAGLQTQLRTIRFGTIIEMTPRYDSSSGRVEVQISADVSELTPPVTGNVPGRSRTAVTTLVNLQLGQSIMLGGLTSRSTQQSQAGLPGLSQIPILGVLFGSNQRREEAQENFVFVVPTVTQAVGRAQQDRIREALRVYESFGSIGGSGLGDIELVEPSPPNYE
ncbi:MAG: type II and III secretion system protein [Deltaproteobacteria bacterium]|nr:type II and III secretion system protein [Deltaproteobacteria bacterium]